MRLFFGIDIPEEYKEKIEDLKCKIKVSGRIKWVEKENLHITLVFLGEKNLEDVIRLTEGFKFEPFNVSLKDFGVFPDLKRPRVLWIRVENGVESIKSLYEKLISRLEPLNIEKEERFTPHLTIGRIKNGTVDYRGLSYKSDTFFVDRFFLFSSKLTESGPIYQKEKIYKCGGSNG